MMRADDLDFFLPAALIAQAPTPHRGGSRLLHYEQATQSITHRLFSDLPSLLRAGDMMVFNDARVIPARFVLQKNTGGIIEGLFLAESHHGRWRVMLKNLGRYTGPLHFVKDPQIQATFIESKQGGEYEIEVQSHEGAGALLARLGRMPLPPYIKREKDHDARDEQDRIDYQTVYARASGSVAVPTAGLHFTQPILDELRDRKIERVNVTLHVGMGTFKPVTAETLESHAMHSERYEIEAEAAEKLNQAEKERSRIVAVGTTSARVLESYPERAWTASTGDTSIFIYPPYQWKRVRSLLTNFHLPRSTLIALVAAMVGLEEQRRIYRTAIENRYRFFSYGDAMLID